MICRKISDDLNLQAGRLNFLVAFKDKKNKTLDQVTGFKKQFNKHI